MPKSLPPREKLLGAKSKQNGELEFEDMWDFSTRQESVAVL